MTLQSSIRLHHICLINCCACVPFPAVASLSSDITATALYSAAAWAQARVGVSRPTEARSHVDNNEETWFAAMGTVFLAPPRPATHPQWEATRFVCGGPSGRAEAPLQRPPTSPCSVLFCRKNQNICSSITFILIKMTYTPAKSWTGPWFFPTSHLSGLDAQLTTSTLQESAVTRGKNALGLHPL